VVADLVDDREPGVFLAGDLDVEQRCVAAADGDAGRADARLRWVAAHDGVADGGDRGVGGDTEAVVDELRIGGPGAEAAEWRGTDEEEAAVAVLHDRVGDGDAGAAAAGAPHDAVAGPAVTDGGAGDRGGEHVERGALALVGIVVELQEAAVAGGDAARIGDVR